MQGDRLPMNPEMAGSLYRIGTVSRLSGIPVPTIRMWERRYQLVTPGRTPAGGRLYSQAELERLMLLKAAVDAGHAIGTVAHLPDEDIRARLHGSGIRRAPVGEDCRVATVGRALGLRLESDWRERQQLQIAGIYADLQAAVVARPQVDALVIERPTLQVADVRAILEAVASLRPRLTVVVYGFANRSTLKRLDREGMTAVRGPVDTAHLARICLMSLNLVPPEVSDGVEKLLMRPVPARQFDEGQLSRIAGIDSAIKCECPHHLAALLVSLNAFERYSLDCESADAGDAATHAMLYAAAAQCRHLLENALQHVLERENLVV